MCAGTMISHWHNEKRLGVIHIVAKAWQSPKCRNKFSRCIYGRCLQSNHITKHHGPPSTDADPWGRQFYLKAEITNHYLQSHKVVTINLPRSAWVHHLISNEHHLSNFFAYYYTSLYGDWRMTHQCIVPYCERINEPKHDIARKGLKRDIIYNANFYYFEHNTIHKIYIMYHGYDFTTK